MPETAPSVYAPFGEVYPSVRLAASSGRLRFLDGFRGVSILVVVLGHALISLEGKAIYLLPFFDANIGVRVFFVVSGFVISRGLFSELEVSGKVSLLHFFLKRVSKLLPTLLLYVAAVRIFEFFSGSVCPLAAYLAALSFTTEIFAGSCWNFGHTWSLSTEEFFYLSWTPLFAYFKNRFVYLALPLVFLIAPSVRVLDYLHGHNQYTKLVSWYRPVPVVPHLDIILSGCLFAFLLKRYHREFVTFSERMPFLVPVAVASIYFWTLPAYKIPALHFVGWIGLPFAPTMQGLAVGYLIAVMASGRRIAFLSGILNSRVFVYLGRISYSLYLWQQIFLVPTGTDLNIGLAALKITAVILVGSLSFHFFEEPIRKALRRRWNLSF